MQLVNDKKSFEQRLTRNENLNCAFSSRPYIMQYKGWEEWLNGKGWVSLAEFGHQAIKNKSESGNVMCYPRSTKWEYELLIDSQNRTQRPRKNEEAHG